MNEKKLAKMPYAQAKIRIYDDGSIYLISYATTVAEIENGILKINGLYSATTRKHIGAFMSEYCRDNYQTAKYLYENNLRLNLATGDVF